MSIEDELRDSLHRRAASVQVQPDLDDVGARAASRERRTRRLLTAGLVVALIAGPLAGFAIGSARDDGRSEVATGSGAAGQEIARSAGDAAMSDPAIGTGTPLEKLFFRTTSDGVAIRAYRSAVVTPAPEPLSCVGGPGVDCPATPECLDPVIPTSTVAGELSTEAAVTMASGIASPTSDSAVSAAAWGTFGIEESAPARWVIARVNESTVRVRATFPGGTTDEMEPVDGVAILASQVADPNLAGGTLEALDGDGTVVQSVDLAPGAGSMASASSASGSASGSAESRAELHTESSSGGSGSSTNASSSASSSGATDSPGIATTCVTPTPVPAPAPALTSPGEQPADPGTATACNDPSLVGVTCSPEK